MFSGVYCVQTSRCSTNCTGETGNRMWRLTEDHSAAVCCFLLLKQFINSFDTQKHSSLWLKQNDDLICLYLCLISRWTEYVWALSCSLTHRTIYRKTDRNKESDQYVGDRCLINMWGRCGFSVSIPVIRNQGDRLLISGTDVHLKLNTVSNVLLYLSISIFRN